MAIPSWYITDSYQFYLDLKELYLLYSSSKHCLRTIDNIFQNLVQGMTYCPLWMRECSQTSIRTHVYFTISVRWAVVQNKYSSWLIFPLEKSLYQYYSRLCFSLTCHWYSCSVDRFLKGSSPLDGSVHEGKEVLGSCRVFEYVLGSAFVEK